MSTEQLDAIVSGVIYDFAGFLTTREERIIASATDNSQPMADAVKEFLTMRKVDQNCNPVFDWELRCSATVATLETQSLPRKLLGYLTRAYKRFTARLCA